MEKRFKSPISLPIDGNMTRLFFILIAILLVASITKTDNFLNAGNFQSVGKQLAEYGLMSLGVAICMISGGIDLSTVYIANLAGISAGLFMKHFAPETYGANQLMFMALAILIGLVIGAVCGAFNGILVSFFRIPPMLVTLGTYQLFMGISIVLSNGSTVSGIPKAFRSIGNELVFGVIPLPFIIFIAVAVILGLVLSKTKFGTRVYLVGTNYKASKFAGIKNHTVLIQTYMISGIISSIAGIVSLSRMNSAKADFGSSYTMQSILIVVLGGLNPNGGFGNIAGVTIAVIILQILSSYLNMFPNISNYYRDLIWGVALIGVLILNYNISKRKNRSK